MRQLHRGLLQEPLPPGLATAAQQATELRRRGSQWWRWGGMAASVALAFALGWLAHGQWPGKASTLASNSTAVRFAHQAAVAHVVYMPKVRHPVEVTAAQQDHLVQWLSKRLGRPQFMFQNATGERVTLYIGAVKEAGGAGSNKETAFRFIDEGPVPGFYWVDQGFGYALAGKLPRQALMDLATAVYEQLEN